VVIISTIPNNMTKKSSTNIVENVICTERGCPKRRPQSGVGGFPVLTRGEGGFFNEHGALSQCRHFSDKGEGQFFESLCRSLLWTARPLRINAGSHRICLNQRFFVIFYYVYIVFSILINYYVPAVAYKAFLCSPFFLVCSIV